MRSLPLAALVCVAALAACGGKPAKAPQRRQATRPTASIDTSAGAAQEFVYDAGKARDPFVPVWIAGQAGARKGVARPALRVNAILWDAVNPSAMINDRVVGEGQTVEGATVVKIAQNSVTMSFGGETFTIHP